MTVLQFFNNLFGSHLNFVCRSAIHFNIFHAMRISEFYASCFRLLERECAVSFLILSTFVFIRYILSFIEHSSLALAATAMQFALRITKSRLSTIYVLNLATHNVFARTLGHSIDSEKPCGMHFVVIYNVVNYSQVIATKQISFREFKRKTSELSGNHSGCNKTNAALSPTIDSIILFSRHKEHSDEYK